MAIREATSKERQDISERYGGMLEAERERNRQALTAAEETGRHREQTARDAQQARIDSLADSLSTARETISELKAELVSLRSEHMRTSSDLTSAKIDAKTASLAAKQAEGSFDKFGSMLSAVKGVASDLGMATPADVAAASASSESTISSALKAGSALFQSEGFNATLRAAANRIAQASAGAEASGPTTPGLPVQLPPSPLQPSAPLPPHSVENPQAAWDSWMGKSSEAPPTAPQPVPPAEAPIEEQREEIVVAAAEEAAEKNVDVDKFIEVVAPKIGLSVMELVALMSLAPDGEPETIAGLLEFDLARLSLNGRRYLSRVIARLRALAVEMEAQDATNTQDTYGD
jgi:hypothetical protein